MDGMASSPRLIRLSIGEEGYGAVGKTWWSTGVRDDCLRNGRLLWGRTRREGTGPIGVTGIRTGVVVGIVGLGATRSIASLPTIVSLVTLVATTGGSVRHDGVRLVMYVSMKRNGMK